MVLSALVAGGVLTPGPALVSSQVRRTRTANFEIEDEYSRNARSAKKSEDGLMVLQRRLYCQTKYSLQILPNGKVNGTKNHSSKFAVLDFIPISRTIVYIKGVASDLYLCMNHEGRLLGLPTKSEYCSFVESYMAPQSYNTYHSYKQSSKRRKWFISLSKLGRTRRGYKSRRRHKSTKFLKLPPNYNIQRFRQEKEEEERRKHHRRKLKEYRHRNKVKQN